MKRWLMLLMLEGVVSAQAANYVWNGAGVTGGTSDTRWEEAGNWLVEGVPPATPPAITDDVSVTLNTDHTTNVAVTVSAGATASNVTFRGMNTTGRMVEFQGDTEFSTLDYDTARSTLNIVAGVKLTLTGGEIIAGAVTKATLKTPAVFSVYNILGFPGQIRCTGNQVGLQLNGVLGDIYVDNPDATVHFMNTTIRMGGNLYVCSTQQVLGLNATTGMMPTRYSLDLYSTDGAALTNWGACNIGGISYTMSSGAPFTVPAGTYNSINVYAGFHYSGNAVYDISGDVTFDGVNSSGYAVYMHRHRYDAGYLAAGADFGLNSNDLTVTNGGPIQIGDFTDTNQVWWSRLKAQCSTITTDGDINIGPGGYIVGDTGTVICLAGDWDNRCAWQTNSFTLVQSTVSLCGTGNVRNVQGFEVQGKDLGATLAGQVSTNTAFGRLEVGTPAQPTYARLRDLTDGSEDGLPDAHYVGELEVPAGSTLDIYGLNLYVNGVSVRGHWHDFGAGLIFDSKLLAGTVVYVE